MEQYTPPTNYKGSMGNYQAPQKLYPNDPNSGGPPRVGTSPSNKGGYQPQTAGSPGYTPSGSMQVSQPGKANQNYGAYSPPWPTPQGAPAPTSNGTAPIGQVYQPAGMQPNMFQQQPAAQMPAMPQGGDAGQMNVQTSINPIGVFSDQQTQRELNQQRANVATNSNRQWLMKQMGGAGRSMGMGQAAQVNPRMAEAASQMGNLGATVPFSDAAINMQSYRGGQEARDAEANQLAGLGLYGQNAAFQNNLNNQQAMINSLLGFI